MPWSCEKLLDYILIHGYALFSALIYPLKCALSVFSDPMLEWMWNLLSQYWNGCETFQHKVGMNVKPSLAIFKNLKYSFKYLNECETFHHNVEIDVKPSLSMLDTHLQLKCHNTTMLQTKEWSIIKWFDLLFI